MRTVLVLMVLATVWAAQAMGGALMISDGKGGLAVAPGAATTDPHSVTAIADDVSGSASLEGKTWVGVTGPAGCKVRVMANMSTSVFPRIPATSFQRWIRPTAKYLNWSGCTGGTVELQ